MLKSMTFEITGSQRLACEGCEERVEDVLKSLQGVEKVRAHAGKQRVDVLFDTAVLDPKVIAQRLGEAGYETTVRN